MKKTVLYPIALCLGFLGMISCSGEKQKVQTFAETFAGFVNGNQMDSVKMVYPSANFDSIAPLSVDSMSVSSAADGLYKVNFGSSKWIEVKVTEDGTIVVLDSKGVAAFAEGKYEIAVSSGMLTDSIGDLKAHELLKDDAYFEWLKENYGNGGYVIQIKHGKCKNLWKSSWGEGSKGTITVTLTNLSDSPISGSDYFITYTTYESNGYTDESRRYYTRSNKHKGIDLKPKESGTINLSQWETYKFYNFEIKPIEGKEGALKYQFKPTGNEYQEYLKECKENANPNFDWLSTREATPKDLENKSKEQLRIMRNWIYARQGYIFKSKDLTEYFEKFPWYEPTSKNVTSEFNKIEQANVSLIQSYE